MNVFEERKARRQRELEEKKANGAKLPIGIENIPSNIGKPSQSSEV